VSYANGQGKIQVYSQEGQLLFSYRADQGSTHHVYLGSTLVAEVNSVTGTRYMHADALGSPIARTSSTGGVVNRTSYEPYGGTVAGTTNPDGIGFTGHVNDPDTGLVYMQQRYYDPLAGRFLSVDPVTTDAATASSFNRYVYGDNNPYGYVDPDGRQTNSAFEYYDPYGGLRSVFDDIGAGAKYAAAKAASSSLPDIKSSKDTAIKTTFALDKFEVSRTTGLNGSSTELLLRTPTAPQFQVTVEQRVQYTIGDVGNGSGLLAKLSAGMGKNDVLAPGSVSLLLNSGGVRLTLSTGIGYLGNRTGTPPGNLPGGLALRPPALAIGGVASDKDLPVIGERQ
jgi:RHS repeat-associated protein